MKSQNSPSTTHRRPTRASSPPLRLGCVSYLNAKPLIEGIEGRPDPVVRFDVPSRLLEDLERGSVDLALCPVIDYFRCPLPLAIVPAGGIGSNGTTFTVRLYSRVPIERITTVHADTDSHTSIALLRVLLRKMHGLTPRLVDYDAGACGRADASRHASAATPKPPASRRVAAPPQASEPPAPPEAMLLIGDKVVTASPLAVEYPHQLDLGEAWKELTGLPFVFATWMCRPETDLGDLPALLDQQRRANQARLPEIVAKYAPRHGWPHDLAQRYLGEFLQYEIGPVQLEAIHRFGELAQAAGVVEQVREIRLYGG